MKTRRKQAPRVWRRAPFRRAHINRQKLRLLLISTPMSPEISRGITYLTALEGKDD